MSQPTIKAIETKYKGYRFRSRLEARWAVFFDFFGEEWEYEKEGFEFSEKRYLPDFWLPRLGCWLEIKGDHPSQDEFHLCKSLSQAIDQPVAIAWGLPQAVIARPIKSSSGGWSYREFSGCTRLTVYCGDCTDGSAGESEWDQCFLAICKKESNLCICSNNDHSSRAFCSPSLDGHFPGMKLLREIAFPIHEQMIEVAKSARFEHGESP